MKKVIFGSTRTPGGNAKDVPSAPFLNHGVPQAKGKHGMRPGLRTIRKGGK